MLTQKIIITRTDAQSFHVSAIVYENDKMIDNYTDTITADTWSGALTQMDGTMEDIGYEARHGWTEYREGTIEKARNTFRAETV